MFFICLTLAPWPQQALFIVCSFPWPLGTTESSTNRHLLFKANLTQWVLMVTWKKRFSYSRNVNFQWFNRCTTFKGETSINFLTFIMQVMVSVSYENQWTTHQNHNISKQLKTSQIIIHGRLAKINKIHNFTNQFQTWANHIRHFNKRALDRIPN